MTSHGATARSLEVRLVGPGAGSGVVRAGDTVRRPAERTPDAMVLVLQHLEAVGFTEAPRVLGRDRGGDWVFSYVPGETLLPPYPAWAAGDATLASVARLLRRYHDAVAGFREPAPIAWPTVPPPEYAGDLVGHMDVSLANVVLRGDQASALIDFEEVGRVARVWDFVRTVRHWVPLLDPRDLDPGLAATAGRAASRLGLFADAYGLGAADRAAVVDAALHSADVTYTRMRDRAAAGHPGYLREWTGSAALRNRRGKAWVAAQRGVLEAAL